MKITMAPDGKTSADETPYVTRATVTVELADGTVKQYVVTGNMRGTIDGGGSGEYEYMLTRMRLAFVFDGVDHIQEFPQ